LSLPNGKRSALPLKKHRNASRGTRNGTPLPRSRAGSLSEEDAHDYRRKRFKGRGASKSTPEGGTLYRGAGSILRSEPKKRSRRRFEKFADWELTLQNLLGGLLKWLGKEPLNKKRGLPSRGMGGGRNQNVLVGAMDTPNRKTEFRGLRGGGGGTPTWEKVAPKSENQKLISGRRLS